MEKKNTENNPTNLWNRRANTHSSGKLSLSTTRSDRNDSHDTPSNRRVGSLSSHGNRNPFNNSSGDLASPKATSAGAASFGLGSGAFGFGGASKTPKTPGASFDLGKTSSDRKESSDDSKDSKRPPARKSQASLRTPSSAVEPAGRHPQDLPLKSGWVIYIRPPTSKNSDYEKSIKEIGSMHTAFEFWGVFRQLKHPSGLPAVSDYHFFKKGIRPVWEDEANRKGGKWIMRLKKGVADRYWEDLRLAMVGEQFDEASDEVCGAVVSVRSGEDVISVWTRNDGGRNVKIRESLKRLLNLPADTIILWKSHDESITQRHTIDQARQEKANHEKRRNTTKGEEDPVDTRA
ncbi:related to mRNA cap-binding related to eIF-4E [Lecanosticta acicola]|uniref:Related to mRNA cap-binding related to eIF-4E n=1 Tax=Lecanosticta acicola TaxID=111012 RepID=A0AAI9E941_9PEZI|nr:related to mRNA cap-binding related to eIF-4E [Lecanosticta acicola]